MTSVERHKHFKQTHKFLFLKVFLVKEVCSVIDADIKCTSTQVYKYTSPDVYKYTSVQVHVCTSTQVHKCTSAQVHECTSAQVHKCTSQYSENNSQNA